MLLALTTVIFAQQSFSPKNEAIKQLNSQKAKLEKEFEGVMNEAQAFVGDINGDGKPDCILSYIFTPKEGGNLIVGHGCNIYFNIGRGMKYAGRFPELDFCYTPKRIENQQIIVDKFTCAPPYNDDLGKARLIYKKGKIILVR